MTTSFDDPDFMRFLFGKVPVNELNEAFDDYLRETGKVESFDSWFNRLPFNAELMNMIHMIYQFDQQGKQSNEALLLNFTIKKRIPKQSRKYTKEQIDAQVEAFSDFVAKGGLRHEK